MRRIIFSLSMFLPALLVSAKVLSPDEALARLSGEDRQRVRTVSERVPAFIFSGDTGATAYAFRGGDCGFMLVSADDCAAPLLGYSATGRFDGSDLPCGLRVWMDTYSRQIDAARRSGSAFCYAREPEADREPLAPALTTQWGQAEPYNNLCPTGAGGRCVTGCVATAMAQVLNHYKHPVTGTGEHSYMWSFMDADLGPMQKELGLDFATLDFDWGNMLDSYAGEYTEEQAHAVAELMYACGIAADMDYGTGASGTQQGRVPYALWQYLGFNPGITLADRDCFREDDMTWDDFVYEELESHGAVLYCGVTSDKEGHAFVCDGYEGDGYFHFNWGWNGMSDGWFRLSALNPAMQGTGGSSTSKAFNFYQNITANLNPGAEGEVYMPNITGRDVAFATSTKTAKLGAKFTVSGYIINNTQLDYDVEFGCMLTDTKNGTEGIVVKVCDIPLKACTDNTIFKKVALPADLPDGMYCVRPVVRWEGLGYWWTLPWPVVGDHFWMQVKDGMAGFNVDPGSAGMTEVSEGSSGQTRYYNLEGMEVAEPESPGVYIKRTGTETEKLRLF